MKPFFNVILILLFVWRPCFGAWSEVARNIENTRYFLDFGKMQRVEPYTYAWLLVNYLEPDQSGDMSEVHYIKVHCGDVVYRTLKVLRFGGPMGLGNVTENFVPSNSLDWVPPKEGTAREAVITNACDSGLMK